jgi:hypothetical protein
VRIHAYFIRKIRSSNSGENEKITILAIFCKAAKQRGDQYTKRILPAFVTPGCNVMLWSVMKYVARYRKERINYAKAAMILGARDPRTIRRHILGGREIIEKTTLELTRELSGLPGFARLPEQKPGVGRYESLAATVRQIDGAVSRMDGADSAEVPPICYVHVVYMFHRALNPVKTPADSSKTPLSHVLHSLAFDDTS